MNVYTENFRLAAAFAAAAWTHAATAIDNARWTEQLPSETGAARARRAAEAAALASLDATKLADAALAKGNDAVRDAAASAHDAYTIATRAADAAVVSAAKLA